MGREQEDGLEADRDRAWEMLDLLPRGVAHPSLASTTIEMAAVTAEAVGRGASRGGSAGLDHRWVTAAVLIVGALAAGFAAGNASRTAPEGSVAMAAAVARHLPVLREAGSVDFLEAFTRKGFPPPRRFAGPRGGGPEDDAVAPAYPELDAAIEDFRSAFATDRDASSPGWDRRRLDEALSVVERLSSADRQALVATARALADPSGADRVEAARRWHQWVIASDPVERKILPTLSTKERIEWLTRRSRAWRPPSMRGPFPPPGVNPPRETPGPRG